jgi:CDP-diacylglycerol--glycerol-3-phosphate 3-phosphatidyltransferase
VTPIIQFFTKIGIHPNWITALGFLLNIVASGLIYYSSFVLAGVFVGIAGIFDFIDGKVAALLQRRTKFGAIFDSILDRYSDVAIYLALILYFFENNFRGLAWAALLALIGSVMTSYIKAIGESHGFHFRGGALRRQERITLICFGLLFSFVRRWAESIFRFPFLPLSLILYFLAIFTNFSAVQRFFLLRKISQNQDRQNQKQVLK